jgi:hypothetical protein
MPDDAGDEPMPTEIVDPETRQLLGMFDLPAFARRGQELDSALVRLHARCRHQRAERLDMVHLRLRQWAAAVEGPDAWRPVFAAPFEPLWRLAEAPAPTWAVSLATPRRRRAIGRDLIASVDRFNRRWDGLLQGIQLDAINTLVDHYNRYYLLEKECVLRSSRLAARLYTPRPRVTVDALRESYPPLPLPQLA